MSATKKYTILGIGAHVDDCWLGFGATALKAVKRGHRVLFMVAVTDFDTWPVLRGRGSEAHAHLEKIARDSGIELIRLKHGYMRVQNNPALIEELVHQISAVKPDVLFCHDPNESNEDHNQLGKASIIAASHTECFTRPDEDSRGTREIYKYTTGWQSQGFTPDVTVDVSDTLFESLRYASTFDELYAQGKYPTKQMTVVDHQMDEARIELTGHTRYKFAQSIAFGGGGGYAEAFKSYWPIHVQYRKLPKIVGE
jgi:LmbE family N-acetylglucosaminyl deacetylase